MQPVPGFFAFARHTGSEIVDFGFWIVGLRYCTAGEYTLSPNYSIYNYFSLECRSYLQVTAGTVGCKIGFPFTNSLLISAPLKCRLKRRS